MSDWGHHQVPINKLRLFKTPLVKHDDRGRHDADDLPEFERHTEPTLLEIFYDLFFAANYNVFSDTQHVTNHARFKAYIGYFCLLWLTWFLVTLYDIRYVTDSIFTRMTRAVQLGVLVGFAVVAPKFDPTNQEYETMRAMSIILMISRVSLAIEYGSTLYHVRKFRKARLPIWLQIAVHSMAAVVYFGITFAFKSHHRSRAYMTWYFISGAEAISALLLSNFSPVLSLTKTHLIKRLIFLTVMIMGDGIIQVAKDVVIIVKNPDAWNTVVMGLVTAATATIYFVFLVYFDWLRSYLYLPAWRQQLWTSVHLPFHVALVLFMQGLGQLLIWSKITDTLNFVLGGLGNADGDWIAGATSIQIKDYLNATTQDFFKLYPPKILSTDETVNAALANITRIPDDLWPEVARFYAANGQYTAASSQSLDTFVNALGAIVVSMANALFATFGINLEGDITTKHPGIDANVEGGWFQGQVTEKTFSRYNLVFAYTYVATGCTLILMIALAVIARLTPYKTWPIVRLVIIFVLALGTGLTSLLFFNKDRLGDFIQTPWMLPIITIVWTIVLVITHINGEGCRRNAHRFRLRRRARTPAHCPASPSTAWANGDVKHADDLDAGAQRRPVCWHGPDDEGDAAWDGTRDLEVAWGPNGNFEKPHWSEVPTGASTESKGASNPEARDGSEWQVPVVQQGPRQTVGYLPTDEATASFGRKT